MVRSEDERTARPYVVKLPPIPIFGGFPASWPRLPASTFSALLGGVALRNVEVLADWAWAGVLPWLPLSRLLVWLVAASVFAALLETLWSGPERLWRGPP